MDAAAFEAQKARISAYWTKWRQVLGMDEWTVTHIYHDGDFVRGDGEPSGEAMASAWVRWEYRRARIDWNVEEAARCDDDYLETTVVHEAMHVLLHEMRDDGIKHEERVATSLAHAFMRASEMAG